MRRIFSAVLIAALTTATVTNFAPALGQTDIRQERVQFQPGASSAIAESSITGYEIVDYVLGASEGQYMNISMATDNLSNYFNILMPGEDEVAMFNGSIRENQYEGILEKSGDYKVRVYMMRNAARRNEVANYRLEMIITEAEDSYDNDALVEGTEYNATGNIPCAMTSEQPTGSCFFGVKREGNGTGLVTITKLDGQTRTIFFEDGKATGYDASQADPGEFEVEEQGDLSIIRIGQERYEIPDAVIFGG
ncbi:hypothetical protein Xen7305DRAFT_00001380 [Xenococcus sp. PCC 7305]|uniref:hypothetical protein n=1 Tax=Xenococcus sp. PCC 7305 TaxID=102125 RepID=UPI0002ACFF8F|nr:hypothetical protein [Xenococcus sp. PCC 7305]ELS00437.1 hypothetical protein Xen7305DRAFT_00001380 [Xenococcus sp. PCC 7305]